jgi:hypothetical protein
MLSNVKYPPIGISGAARSGKDTLCLYIKQRFKEKYQLKAQRVSVAGDSIKKDLYSIIKNKTGISTFTTNSNEKSIVRPVLVEYGQLMRRITQGRYFITQLQKNKNFESHISIITDIRYAEYPQDELIWLKQEVKGLLVFLERKEIKNANKFEAKNNNILKQNADLIIKTKTFNNPQDLQYNMIKYADKIIDLYVSHHLPIGHLSAFK